MTAEKQREENTPESKESMRQLWPMMVDLLKVKQTQEQLGIEGKVVDWDAVNASNEIAAFRKHRVRIAL